MRNTVKRNDVGQFEVASSSAKADRAYAGDFNFTYTDPAGNTQTFQGSFTDESPQPDPNA